MLKIICRIFFIALLAFVFQSEGFSSTFYVSSTGNDSNSGLSTSTAWRSLTKVNSINFSAGDRILFEGGKTFSGKISLDPNDHGTATSPIVFSSYGSGRAIISAGSDNGLFAYNIGGILVSNLNFVGAGATSGSQSGVAFYADAAGNVKFSGITIDSVEVSGFGKAGVSIGAWNNQTGYRDVRVANVSAHDNLHAGFETFAAMPNTHSNVYVGHCMAFNNFGNPSSTGNTGSGIVLGDVTGGTVERCVTHDNGKNNFAVSEGPVGIWAYDSTNITIQFCESYSNHTGSAKDGGGFDLDVNTKNSVMQYNYSHDNDGAGFLLCCDAANSGNVIRYNISQNDGRKNGFAAIHTYGNITSADIYNNTIYMAQTTGSPRAIWLTTPTTNIRIRNNIFYSSGGARLLEVVGGQTGLMFQDNSYFATGAFSIFWNGANYTSFDGWRNASGQEFFNGTKTGSGLDPKLASPGTGATLNNADSLSSLSAYKLQSGSPLIDSALNLNSLFSMNPGQQDFYGTTVFQGKGYDVGAFELPTIQSSIILSAPKLVNGNFQLSLTGPVGATNAFEVSTNLVNWTSLTNIVNTTGTIVFTDTTSKTFSKHFYRARQF